MSGHDHHSHGHGHSHAVVGPDTDARRLTIGLALIVGFMVAEVVAGILADSLALLSDAAHMLTDAGALLLSLIVLRLVRRPAEGNLTFGLRRTEILSAQANGATLLVLGGLIVFGAIQRLIDPPSPEGGVMLDHHVPDAIAVPSPEWRSRPAAPRETRMIVITR